MKRDILLPGKLLVTWFISGAVLCGGALVSYGLFEESLGRLRHPRVHISLEEHDPEAR